MPKTKEDKKQYDRLHYLKNKEKIKEKNRLHYLNNKDNNKDKIKEYDKEYRQTEQGKKTWRISKWKQYGILCFDWNLLYDIFLSTTTCEFCEVELTVDRYNTSTTKCLDHDHSITDKFNIRGVLCNSCNIKDVLKITTQSFI